MNKLMEPQLSERPPVRNRLAASHKALYFVNWLLIICAIIAGIVLLLGDVFPPGQLHAPISALPLLLIGAAYLAFQVVNRPGLLDLFKALIVSSAFILWGIDQLLPAGWLTIALGDLVIVLYVIDLSWMMADRLKQQGRYKIE